MIGTELLLEGFTNDYVADTAEDGDIWMVDVDGTNATRVTRGPAIVGWPEWVSGSVA